MMSKFHRWLREKALWKSGRKPHPADLEMRELLKATPSVNSPEAFDQGVLEALRRPETVRRTEAPVFSLRCLTQWKRTAFLTHLAGGGLVAVFVTVVCLLATLQPQRHLAGSHRNEPTTAGQTPTGVPIESLLRDSFPHSGQLWVPPATDPRSNLSPLRRSLAPRRDATPSRHVPAGPVNLEPAPRRPISRSQG